MPTNTYNILNLTNRFRFMVFNATFNTISVISWLSVLLVEETGENCRPVASHWQTLSHNVVSSSPRLSEVRTHNISGGRHPQESNFMKLYEGITEHQDFKKFCRKRMLLILFSKFICILYIVVTIFWTFFQNNFTRDEVTFIVGLVTEASRGLKYCSK